MFDLWACDGQHCSAWWFLPTNGQSYGTRVHLMTLSGVAPYSRFCCAWLPMHHISRMTLAVVLPIEIDEMTSWPIDQYTQHMNITYCCHHYGNDETNVIYVCLHDAVIKWKHFPRNWPFVRGIHRSPVNSPHKGQWRGALMFFLSASE